MPLYGTRRSRDRRIAHLVIALVVVACRKNEASRPLDAARPDAVPVDAPAPDAEADAAVKPAPFATKLVASGDSTCAVMSDLTLRCWGGNDHGQLGNGLTAATATPVTPEIRAVKDLQLADGTACALLDDSSVACWGRLGWHGHAEDVLRPTGVLGLRGVTRIFVLAGRACARVDDDSLVCWGNVDARGHFAPGPTNRAPTPVVGLDHVAGMTASGAFSDDGRFWYWTAAGVPRLINVTGVQELADRGGDVCGRLATGRVACAPSDRCGSRRSSPTPTPPPAKPATTKPATTKPATTKPATTKPGKTAKSKKPAKPGTSAKPGKSTRSAATKPAEPVKPVSSGSGGGESSHMLGFTAVRQLAFDFGFCVVTTDSKLVCGDGCRQVEPPRLERVIAMVGRCAFQKSGNVACFDDGKVTVVPGLARASLLAVGRAHACAVVERKIRCWGNNEHGQLGDFAMTP